jgi:hypothetical protein
MVDAQILACAVVEGAKAIGRAGEFEGKRIPEWAGRRLSGKRGIWARMHVKFGNSHLDWRASNTEPPIFYPAISHYGAISSRSSALIPSRYF